MRWGRRLRDSFGKARKPVPPLSKGGGLRSKTEGLYLPPEILPSLCSILLRSSTPLRSAQNDTVGVGRRLRDFYGTTRRTPCPPLVRWWGSLHDFYETTRRTTATLSVHCFEHADPIPLLKPFEWGMGRTFGKVLPTKKPPPRIFTVLTLARLVLLHKYANMHPVSLFC